MQNADRHAHKFPGDLSDSPWPGGDGLAVGLPPGWDSLPVPPPNTHASGGLVLVGDSPPDVSPLGISSDAKGHNQPTAGGTSGTGTATSTSLPAEPASPTPFTIAINWDSSVSSAPAGFTSDVLAAVNYLETQFVDPVTITIDVGYNEIDGGGLGSGDLGESSDLPYVHELREPRSAP